MHSVADKIEVTCPRCGQALRVPALAAGKQGRCPSCQDVFPIAAAAAMGREAIHVAAAAERPRPEQLVQPNSDPDPEPGTSLEAAPGPSSPVKTYNHSFGWEQRGWDAGMMGGLAMMAIGAVWFFGGLAVGIIFYYPPILFLIGLVGFVRGLFSGNVSGRR